MSLNEYRFFILSFLPFGILGLGTDSKFQACLLSLGSWIGHSSFRTLTSRMDTLPVFMNQHPDKRYDAGLSLNSLLLANPSNASNRVLVFTLCLLKRMTRNVPSPGVLLVTERWDIHSFGYELRPSPVNSF